MNGLDQNAAAMVLVGIAAVIGLIVIVGIMKNPGKGLKWIFWLIVLGVLTYLGFSAEILRVP